MKFSTVYYTKTSVGKTTIYPLAAIKFRIPKSMKIIASRYTVQGRYYIHKELVGEFKDKIKFFIDNPLKKKACRTMIIGYHCL